MQMPTQANVTSQNRMEIGNSAGGDGTGRYTSTSSTISGIYRSILSVRKHDLRLLTLHLIVCIPISESSSSVYVLFRSSIWWNRNALILSVFNSWLWWWRVDRGGVQSQSSGHKTDRVVRPAARAAAASRARIHSVAAADLGVRRCTSAAVATGVAWTIRWVTTWTNWFIWKCIS